MKWIKNVVCFHHQTRHVRETAKYGGGLCSHNSTSRHRYFEAHEQMGSGRQRIVQRSSGSCNSGTISLFENHHQTSLQKAMVRWSSSSSDHQIRPSEEVKPVAHPEQPPLISEFDSTGLLDSATPEEVKIASLLARSNLIILRDTEWVKFFFGYDKADRYTLLDASDPLSPLGFIHERSNAIARQLLFTRHPFIASVTDATGNEIFTLRRPFWWITSTTYAEVDGKEIGVVHRRWHLWRKVYELYLGKRRFAVIENPGFADWTFILKDNDGNVLADIDHAFMSDRPLPFAYDCQNLIRFEKTDPSSRTEQSLKIEDLESTRRLTPSERAVVVACVVSLEDNMYRRTHTFLPILVILSFTVYNIYHLVLVVWKKIM